MTKVSLAISTAVLVVLAGCSKPQNAEIASASPQPAFRQIDACSLLTADEIQSVQGEVVTGKVPSAGTVGGSPSTQCVFTTTTPVNSVSLAITQSSAKSPRAVRDFWKKTFHREDDAEKPAEEGEEEEDGKKSPPQKFADLGDEAFWTGSQISTALYVLKGDSYLRISVGGAGDQAVKLEKSRKLAQFALERL